MSDHKYNRPQVDAARGQSILELLEAKKHPWAA
jgi:hypothetical protein